MLKTVSPSTGLPISLADVKNHLRIDFDDDDERLINLIEVARDFIEAETQVALNAQTWDEVLPCFPSKEIELPISPLQSVTSVTYYNASNVSTVWGSSNYYVIQPTKIPGTIHAVSTYPPTYDRPDAVTIRFVAGSTATPNNAKHLIRLLVAHWNENPEAIGNVGNETALGVGRMLHQLQTGSYY
jgi:uncharacterized phiE125 gp8 family phage protein